MHTRPLSTDEVERLAGNRRLVPALCLERWRAEHDEGGRVAFGVVESDRITAVLLAHCRSGEATCVSLGWDGVPSDVATYMLVAAFVGSLEGPVTCWFALPSASWRVTQALGVMGAREVKVDDERGVLIRMDTPALTRLNPSITPPPDEANGGLPPPA